MAKLTKVRIKGKMRTLLTWRFSEKVYPNPSNEEVKKAIGRGRKEFEETYLGKTYPWILSGQTFLPIEDTKTYTTHHPGEPSEIIGKFPDSSCFSKSEVMVLLAKVRKAGTVFAESVPWPKRIELLCEISKVVEERFWLIVAAFQYETGQSLMEAIGEVDEKRDFPLAAALCLEEMHEDLLLPSPKFAGDHNGKRYVPHGVFLNICPFNFPGAIPMDMACKALAMGNAIIEKSSDRSSLCGYLVYECIKIAFERLDIPHEGVLNYVPGKPEVVDLLLASPDIAGVSFTGSSAALDEIKMKHGQMLRNTYCGKAPLAFGSAETSGVNIVVVWHDADVARAAEECVKSFVGRQGQKCSSARIIMVHERVRHLFVGHLQENLSKLQYGDALYDADVGPVITADAGRRIKKTIRDLILHHCVDSSFSKDDTGDYLLHSDDYDEMVPPTVLYATSFVRHTEKLGEELMNTEIFGPVATVITVSDLDEVKRLRDLSEFALTSSAFSRDPDTCITLNKILRTGNTYQNRKCTGALVETECFGGARSRSGSGEKGKAQLLKFGSMLVHPGFYDWSWTDTKRAEFIKKMEDELGIVFSKT